MILKNLTRLCWYRVSCNVKMRLLIKWPKAWKMSVFGVILVRIFPHSEWLRRNTSKLFTQWTLSLWKFINWYRKIFEARERGVSSKLEIKSTQGDICHTLKPKYYPKRKRCDIDVFKKSELYKQLNGTYLLKLW